MRRFRVALLATSLLVVGVLSAAAQPTPPGRETSAESVAKYGLNDPMPVDPEVAMGTLPNGLRYYVRANGKPAHRAELRLVVKAGSVLEDDDQQGVAHFVEHMEFQGTEHFPGQGINDFLSSLGLSIGADANAATSYDDTQYTLRVPTDVPGVLDHALLVLQDWTHTAVFNAPDVERERAIVLAEWRMHLGAGERTEEKVRHIQLEGSRYANRPPIGKPEIIEKVTRDQLLRFYHDWYRPDLMAVIVVGDIDRDATVAMVKQHFSSVPSPSPERPRPAYDVPEHPGTRYAVFTDRETTTTGIELSDLRPARNQGSVGGYRDIMLDQLFAGMMNDRLDELTQKAAPPFLQAQADRGLFPIARTRDEASIQALTAANGVSRGLDALVTELGRVARFGFTDTELTRAKQAMMLGSERVVTESPDRESASRADEYTRNFLEDEALPTIWQELAFHRRFLPAITLAEINALTTDWFPEQNRLVVVSGPEAAGVALPDQAQLAAVVKSASSKKLEPYVDTAAGQSLIDRPPTPGSIVKTTVRTEAGITEWTLSNGATVVLMPTTLRADQILFRATAPGGTSLASDADFIPARVADSVVPAGGVGRFNEVTLDRITAGKAAVVTPFIDEINEGMGGGSTPQDMETMFQLLYLRFTAPRADPVVFAAMQQQARGMLANRTASPDVVFNRTLGAILSQNSPRRAPETPETVDQWNLDKSLAFYKARFGDASNFTFVFVGSFTIDKIKPLVETYIGSLPATHAHETWRDLGIRPPRGIVEKTVEKGIAPKSEVAIVFSGPFPYDDPHKLALRAMSLVLQSRLLDAIREELGATYSITANPESHKFPEPGYSIRIDWTCDPEKTAMLVQRVFKEVQSVRDIPLTPGQTKLVREVLARDFESSSQDNGYLLRQISRAYEDREAAAVAAALDMPTRLEALTGEAIQQAGQDYLDTNNYVQVTLMPETKAGGR